MSPSFLNRLRGVDASATPTRNAADELNARWVLARIAGLGPSEWQTLLRAHAHAGRSGPVPLEDLQDRAERIAYPILDTTNEAGRLALEAAGVAAKGAWRKSLVLAAKGTPDEGWEERDQQLYDVAWEYMSSAEWPAAYAVARRTLSDGDWLNFWSAYRPVLGSPPSDVTPDEVVAALRLLNTAEWERLASTEAADIHPDGSSRSDAILTRVSHEVRRSGDASQVAISIEAARNTAREIALAAAGPEASAAHLRIDAITRGTGTSILVDSRDAELAEPAWSYMDAASNAALIACVKPFMSSDDFLVAWAPYEFTLGARIHGMQT